MRSTIRRWKFANANFLARVIGLQPGSKPGDKLLYGKVVIMTDQDVHGSHIKGLLLNAFKTCWPEHLKAGMLWTFETPVIATYRKGKRVAEFFDELTFDAWATAQTESYEAKFFKGLGSSDPQDMRVYFANLNKHLKQFIYDDEGGKALDLFFDKSKKAADVRKTWMNQPPHVIDYSKPTIKVSTFVHCNLHAYAHHETKNKIPGFYDGLVPVQRKILMEAIKHPKALKVTALAGAISKNAGYHHGEQSANNSIGNLAACYPSSNNLPILHGFGAFGSRLGRRTGNGEMTSPTVCHKVGDDAASARYVSVSLSALAPKLFRAEEFLEVELVDGEPAEPTTYFPILPLAIVNGCSGIAVGYESDVPGCVSHLLFMRLTSQKSHDPLAVLDAIRLRLDGTPFTPLPPAYCGFTGSFTGKDPAWLCLGRFTQNGNEIRVEEIPTGASILGYKAFLDELKAQGKISNIRNASVSNKVNVTFTLQEGFEATHKSLGLELHVDARYKFRRDGLMVSFATLEDYLEEWFKARIKTYEQRYQKQVDILQKAINKQNEKIAMLNFVAERHLTLGTSRNELQKAMSEAFEGAKEFLDVLRATSLSKEGLEEAEQELHKRTLALETYQESSVQSIMRAELDELETVMTKQLGLIFERNFVKKMKMS